MNPPTTPFNEDQRDALQEIYNIAMGRAGKSLALAFDTFIHLSIPQIKIIDVSEITNSLIANIGRKPNVSAVRQPFSGTLQGESFLIFDKEDYQTLADLLEHGNELTDNAENELLLDISNILIGAFHSCIQDIMSIELTASAPVLLAKSIDIADLKLADVNRAAQFVMVEIVFQIDKEGTCCHLAQLMPNQSIETLKSALDCFIAEF